MQGFGLEIILGGVQEVKIDVSRQVDENWEKVGYYFGSW